MAMARANSKKKFLKNAQKVAKSSTLNAVARKDKKGDKKKAEQAKATASSTKPAKTAKAAKPPKVTRTVKKAKSKKSAAKATPAQPPKHAKPKAAKKARTFNAAAKQKSQQKKSQKSTGSAKKALIACVASILVVFACCCVAFASIESSHSQYVPGTTLLDAQTDISGMTEDELRDLLKTRIDNDIATTITLNLGDTSHQIRLADIGTLDIETTVEQAFAPYKNPVERFFATAGAFITGSSPQYDVCTVCVVDDSALASQIGKIAANNDAGPKNAGYRFDETTRGLAVAAARQGVVMNEESTIASIQEALASPSNGDPRRLMIQADVDVAEPQSYDPGQAIFVDTANCFVALYQSGAEITRYPCTPGTSGYATPTGDFYLLYKDAAPTWYNPHSEWSEGMEETIPPGPSNPLGVRALAVSCGNGIFIHGTTNVSGLGERGSHGCVRLSNDDIIKLFDQVSEGIPIIIR